MNARDHYMAGDLTSAIEALNDEVRKQPQAPEPRSFLADLLCVIGNFERADVQLEAIERLLPGAAARVALHRQLIRAETWRQDCHTRGRVPEFLEQPTPALSEHLRALMLLREGDQSAAQDVIKATEESRAPVPGVIDGDAFDDFRDADDMCAPFFEVFTSTGKYYWVPVERVTSIAFSAPKGPLDLLWRQAEVKVHEGPHGTVYFPAIYAPLPEGDDYMLGRKTDWSDTEPVTGRGQRTYLAGDSPRYHLEIGEISFEAKGE